MIAIAQAQRGTTDWLMADAGFVCSCGLGLASPTWTSPSGAERAGAWVRSANNGISPTTSALALASGELFVDADGLLAITRPSPPPPLCHDSGSLCHAGRRRVGRIAPGPSDDAHRHDPTR